ncbi:MAG: hypothetical protein IT250_08210 [Chitinophagaceae bacterium]|nr:hypothetical protein [Chitinophagaceae bacterium]
MLNRLLFVLGMVTLVSSCSILQKSAKQQLADGFYREKSQTISQSVYVDVTNDSIRIYPTRRTNTKAEVNRFENSRLYLLQRNDSAHTRFLLLKSSFDIDFLTIPLKLRIAEKEVPPQLNANLNGAVYFGYRTDIYKISYELNPLNESVRNTNHLGYSIGIFTGLGNTFMSPTNTNSIIQQEYDGIVWTKGIAAIIGVNNFTVGLSVGFDNLLDRNNRIWIYESKPWIGLAFGLNLN